MSQIVNLAKIFGGLITKGMLPLHFLKVIEFEEMDKPTIMFMHLLLSEIFESSENQEQVITVFT